MSDEEEFTDWLPAPGPLSMPCERCRAVGGVALEHRLEWADPPAGGWVPGVPATRLAQACRGCGSDFLATARRMAVSPGGQLRDVVWATCQQCGGEAAGRLWAWVVCASCGLELRATWQAPEP
ncbi:hypothetical protein [Streptomyces sp. NPDC059278]|uniref:hypothetical protein n=1 Tax=Streptomyces sp. NPDC059278 TaxID=3346801 RepID=UPI00367E1CFB